MRACQRLGGPALTTQIVREVQQEALRDYRHVQVTLLRLFEQGYVLREMPSPRRSLWSLASAYRDVLKGEIRLFIERSLGSRGDGLSLFYEALAESEAASEAPGYLSAKLRVRLFDCLRLVLERKASREALCETLGVNPKVLEGHPASAEGIVLIKAAGGYTCETAIVVLAAIDGLGELDSELRVRVEGLRQELGEA